MDRVLMVTIEGFVLVTHGWKCPLTTYAERLGAPRGSLTDIFLPKWLADRAFPICGAAFAAACLWRLARLAR